MSAGRKRTSLAGLSSDFDTVVGGTKVADEPKAPPAADQPIQQPIVQEPAAAEEETFPPEPTTAVQEPQKPARAPKSPKETKPSPMDEQLARIRATKKRTEYLNARIPRYLDEAIDDLLRLENRDRADDEPSLKKQELVAELLVRALVEHGRGVLG